MDLRNTKNMGTLDGELAAELTLETRLRIAEEIDRLRSADSTGRSRLAGTVVSGVDEGRLRSLIRSTLKQVHVQGGFIRNIPLFEERSEGIRKQIELHKEELVSLYSEIQERERLLRRHSPNWDGRAHGEDGGLLRDSENGDYDEQSRRDPVSIRTEIRSASSRVRWIREEIVSLAEKFAKCVDTLLSLSKAAAQKAPAHVEAAEGAVPAPVPGRNGFESRMVAAESREQRRTSAGRRDR